MTVDYALIWAGLIAFAVLAYVCLDGFDLGVGILFPFAKTTQDRDQMMNSVAPVWDGNETWLVLGGGGLFAVFPLAYSIIMPALYTPFFVMLLALVFRGVAFEFRWKSRERQYLWDWAFAAGSSVAAFAQGVALGTLVQGIQVSGRAFSGNELDWLSPFSLLTGCALLIGYALLGSTWLILKTEGHLQNMAYRLARIAALGLILMIIAVSLWTPFLNPHFLSKWFVWPAMLFVAPVPLLVLISTFILFRGISLRNSLSPFLAAQCLFVLSYIGLVISFFPYIVPSSVTLWDAAAPENSLKFLLIGAVILIPIILSYTAYSYRVFKGKVGSSHSYHS
ncbi:cytochrome d ubiquinol oxidase subunit II [Orrella sp. NBD-18]|uniref:Cytochrome d ubiquinol oxidase subunit II n=1 Tax=Sheuella amnicola TaxID=2707330 RepID=A0A6B2R0Q9_9BURK|nr:cytochrome d ubiquinol oxidase subunit II [Sheuella amnicola]NDY84346.1 cytochrome d ubiquinol oxidase subunit II [Sheuella amnicola]